MTRALRGLEEVSAEAGAEGDAVGLAKANGLTEGEEGAGWVKNEPVVPNEPPELEAWPKRGVGVVVSFLAPFSIALFSGLSGISKVVGAGVDC